jgi:heterogeneous nuclear ribonucleoprotein A1/A3
MDFVISQTKLFVGGLDWKLRGQDLRDAFSQYGEVVFARVVLDKETRRSKGFGFVEFANPEDAAKAQAEMNDKELSGRPIRVDFAKENPEKMQQAAEAAAAHAASADAGDEDVTF